MANDNDRTNGASQQEERPEQQEQSGSGESSSDTTVALQQQLEEARRSVDMFKDQLLRKAAEFENYKRRVLTEQGNAARYANEELMLSLLPILNDFTRSLKSGREQKNFDAFYKGVELIYHKLVQTLERQGLKPFESVGRPFDVDLHDALLQVPRSDVPPNTVIEEVERGFMLNDRVLRHARVVVSSEDPSAPGRAPENDGKGRS